MATRPNRELKIGEIIDRTVDVLSVNGIAVMIFVAVLTASGSVVDVFARQAQQAVNIQARLHAAIQAGVLSLVVLVITIVASYLVIEAMLRKGGLMGEPGDRRLFAFLGLALLTALGFIGGLILLVIPAFVFAARWSLAPSLLIGRRRGVIESMSQSWEKTRGNEVAIIVASLAMEILFYAVAFLPAYLFAEQSWFTAIIARLGSSAASVIGVAMGVALFGLISSRDVSDTFN